MGSAGSLNFECKVFRMKSADKDVHIMWARKYASELYGELEQVADSTNEITEGIKRLHMSSSHDEVSRVMTFLRAEAVRRRGGKTQADAALAQQIETALASKDEQLKQLEHKKEADMEAARVALENSSDNMEISTSFVTLLKLGNDETCANIMRMVTAVMEGGGAPILAEAGLTSVLITKIKDGFKAANLAGLLKLLHDMSKLRSTHSVLFDMGFMMTAAMLMSPQTVPDVIIIATAGILNNMCNDPAYPDSRTTLLHSGCITAIITTLNRTSITSDALSAVNELLRTVMSGRDVMQEPFLAEGGAAALLHAMSVIPEPTSVTKCLKVLRLCCSSLHARRILCNQGCVERFTDIISRMHRSNPSCCIAAIKSLTDMADRSSIGIRDIYVTSGCLTLLLQLLAEFAHDEMAEHIVLVLYHLSTGLLQFQDVLRNHNIIPVLLDCIAHAQHANAVNYRCAM